MEAEAAVGEPAVAPRTFRSLFFGEAEVSDVGRCVPLKALLDASEEVTDDAEVCEAKVEASLGATIL